MEKLLKIASDQAEQAEVFYYEDSSDSIEFTDGKLEKADSSMSSGVALRLIKDGKTGFAHTRNLLDPDLLVRQALLSADNGMEVGFSFPKTETVPIVQSYHPSIEYLSKKELIDRGLDLISYVKSRSDAQFNLGIEYSVDSGGIMNSAGTALNQKRSGFMVYAQMIFPGTGSGLSKFRQGNRRKWLSHQDMDEMIELFEISKTQIVPPTGQMPVIFYPTTVYALMSRLLEGINPANIYNKVSPLCGRQGERIVSEQFNLRQDPFDEEMSSATGFDAEGMPTQKLSFFEQGVLGAIPLDLNYAHKLGMTPTGNGLRGSIESMPTPYPFNLSIDTGDKSLSEMIAGIDRGIIVHSLMGAHSGNILNGDFSVGVSTGFLIEGGKLSGRVKDCMLSGNVYDALNRIVDIEDTALIMGGKFPSIM
ncbi:MAG: TldD/PmbA family protein, partial [Candidatus Cloacimonadaceae bacterium]|nr:TldD/PmbA family protein [Candidatus Cloacimonadaceae bacterium]